MIVFKDVGFSYGEKKIFKKINLEIKEGEFVGVIGSNGSGKTTFLKLMNGLLLPTNGEVEVDGRKTHVQKQNWEIKKLAGYVFQNPENQLVGVTVEEDLIFGMENIGLSPDEMKKRMRKVLNFVGLRGFEKRNVASLSGGQKQRLAIASVLAIGPKYLLLDEPTSMLDPSSRKEVLEVLSKLRYSGKTIVMVSHDLEELTECDRFLFIHRGEILIDGLPFDVLKKVFEDDKLLEHIDIPDSVQIQILLEKHGVMKNKKLLNKHELLKVVMNFVDRI